MFGRFKITGANLEIFKFAFYVSFPVGVMIYVGSDTHRKLNVNNFWPDPARLNYPPKDPVDIKNELERMRAERLERRKRLEEKAKLLQVENNEQEGIEDNSSNESN